MSGNRCFVCPACRTPVEKRDSAYACASCERAYPILFGIPDFRLRGDRYLSLENERAKAAKLHEFGKTHDLQELVALYYSITDDVPAHLELVFTNYVLDGPARSVPGLRALAHKGGRALLDLGCGSGGALAAGDAMFEGWCTGVDIALRWLVIAQKRLEDTGINPRLVCADAEALPFADGVFSHILASDLLEHTCSPAAVIKSASAALEPGGRLYISSSNSGWIGPHAATGVWAAGLMPARLRAWILRRRYGIDILRATTFVSPTSVRRMARSVGFRQLDTGPLQPEMGRFGGRSPLFRFFARSYSMLTKAPFLRIVLLHAGPVFQAVFVKE